MSKFTELFTALFQTEYFKNFKKYPDPDDFLGQAIENKDLKGVVSFLDFALNYIEDKDKDQQVLIDSIHEVDSVLKQYKDVIEGQAA